VYLHRIPKKGSATSTLLRSGRREGGKVINETLANLSSFTSEQLGKLEQMIQWRRLFRDTSLLKEIDFEIATLLGEKLDYRTGIISGKKLDRCFRPPRLW
jgi:hypothetical protein